jgi:hypothetical protein
LAQPVDTKLQRLIRGIVFAACVLIIPLVHAQAPVVSAFSAPRQVVNLGQNLTLSVAATGGANLTYQWRRNGMPIAGATASTFIVANAAPVRSSGWYQVVVSNGLGATLSPVVFVNVVTSPAQIVGSGDNSSGQITIPVGLTNVASVVSGESHSLAVTGLGNVVAFGDVLHANGAGDVPAGLTNVVGVSAGAFHSLALKGDGTLVVWGSYGNGDGAVPAGLDNVVSIASGLYHNLALRSNGTVVAWGVGNFAGQITVPPSLFNVVAVAAGGAHSLALRNDGTVVAWGSNNYGESTVPLGLSNVVAISAGSNYSVALRSDGTVVSFGSTNLSASNVAGLGKNSYLLMADGTASVLGGGLPPEWGQVVGITGGEGFTIVWRDASKDSAPVIVVQPASQSVYLGQSVTFSVGITSGGILPGYQWRKDGGPIAGATGATLTIGSALSANAGSYTVVVTNGAGSSTSNAAILTVSTDIPPAPIVATQPSSQNVNLGANVTFNVTASGATPLSYQWRKDGIPIAGAVNSALTLSNVQTSDAGTYTVLVSNFVGSATSNAAILVVLVPFTNPGRLINLSILAPIAPGETMTVGAVLGGSGTSGTKPLLARAVGPSLGALGVSGTLPDPTMNLTYTSVSPAALIAVNDNWGGTSDLINAFAQVGAFGYSSSGSRDAAIFRQNLTPGNYTVEVSGVGGGAGTVIAELYDSTPSGTFTAATPRLINVSALKQIPGSTTLTAGFVILGDSPLKVLVRAVGPGLAQLGVGGFMADPKLVLFSGQTAIGSNDDWGVNGTTQLSTAFNAVGAFGLPTGSKDAALLATLQPGNYSAQVGVSTGDGGLALVEVYEVP